MARLNPKSIWNFARQRLAEEATARRIDFRDARGVITECLPQLDPILLGDHPKLVRQRPEARKLVDRLATRIYVALMLDLEISKADAQLLAQFEQAEFPWDDEKH